MARFVQGETKGADEKVKVCPVCREGYEELTTYTIKGPIITVEYYGDWWNLRRGKAMERCPKCKGLLNDTASRVD